MRVVFNLHFFSLVCQLSRETLKRVIVKLKSIDFDYDVSALKSANASFVVNINLSLWSIEKHAK